MWLTYFLILRKFVNHYINCFLKTVCMNKKKERMNEVMVHKDRNKRIEKWHTSTLVRNSKVHSHTWQSALWGDWFDCSACTNAKTWKKILQLHWKRTCMIFSFAFFFFHQSEWKYRLTRYGTSSLKVRLVLIVPTSSPQFGHEPFSATKSFIQRPWSARAETKLS